MAPSNSSTNKLAKVARSGKKRTIRDSSDRAFPLAVVAIVLVGSLGVLWGRSVRVSAQAVEPTLDDHWHSAYGTYLCDSFAGPPGDAGPDVSGIHSHEDGVIHIHPFTSAAAGERATIGKFFETVGIEVSDTKLVMPDGTEYETGVTACADGSYGTLALVEWQHADDADAAPTIIREDLADARFENDRMAFVLAFVPEDKLGAVPRPESIANLDQLTDVPVGSTATTVAGDGTATTTSVAGATTTTAG